MVKYSDKKGTKFEQHFSFSQRKIYNTAWFAWQFPQLWCNTNSRNFL